MSGCVLRNKVFHCITVIYCTVTLIAQAEKSYHVSELTWLTSVIIISLYIKVAKCSIPDHERL